MELEHRALNRKRLINETKRRAVGVTLHNLNVVAQFEQFERPVQMQ